ncbi:endonuclease/exonuclease/phosphatase (EEP) superfamily protein YafD [Microbacteriaceae bacterium SG_E_30_P1]|uniref:Endonuclease/exonuclease/phosphatase (EEP) superfamily protein YafD n=1 Tax=Antiquaquibacter oligotrophicus TaxID=2880260 RepID=A0ABT6KK92_9MICO|nr:endonuclease/exonuclease/phosphatase family protein [Antiquaquibacter oligotrophicus]MDH6180420.1 endonuclease/exonuclease/phosphatase (EEP) superfamily protein YafD [Antiquaquibacter oligotrophicus]UDF13842.1 endonuclease/exonuclease/phosphatase family protein [Antiquaquibacter oligotrophicus]
MPRFIAAIIVVLAAAVALVFAWPQLFGLAWAPGVAQVVALRALAAAGGLVLALVLTVIALLWVGARRFLASLAVIALAFAGINTAVLASRGFGDISFPTAAPGDITVLAWNTLGDEPGADTIARLALDNNADVLALPETTNELGLEIAAIMKAEGRPMWVHTVAYDEVSKARSTTLLISADLGEYNVDTQAETTAVLPSVVATPIDGDGPTFVAVHTVAPLPPMEVTWQADLRWVAQTCAEGEVIMAGDFNATLDHFSGMPRSDGGDLGTCRDAADATDNAAVGTWPSRLPALLGAPIDHVMASPQWTATGMRVIESEDAAGSDHRPVLVQYTPTT